MENEWFNIFEPIFNKIIEISPYKKDTGIRVLEYAKKNEDEQYYKEHKVRKTEFEYLFRKSTSATGCRIIPLCGGP
jgi:hypothetical protein